MPRNKLTDLNNHLFAQIERLGEDDMTEEKLKLEIDRSRSISEVSAQIIDNAKLQLQGAKFLHEVSQEGKSLPESLGKSDMSEIQKLVGIGDKVES
ncbi:MAG: hypothetical protein JXR07_20645 [Reichenbachiella sp.]